MKEIRKIKWKEIKKFHPGKVFREGFSEERTLELQSEDRANLKLWPYVIQYGTR